MSADRIGSRSKGREVGVTRPGILDLNVEHIRCAMRWWRSPAGDEGLGSVYVVEWSTIVTERRKALQRDDQGLFMRASITITFVVKQHKVSTRDIP